MAGLIKTLDCLLGLAKACPCIPALPLAPSVAALSESHFFFLKGLVCIGLVRPLLQCVPPAFANENK